MLLGSPEFYMQYPTEEDCMRKTKDYTARNTSKRKNDRTAKCVSIDSEELLGTREIIKRDNE